MESVIPPGLDNSGKNKVNQDEAMKAVESDIDYGLSVVKACAKHGVPRATYYVWKAKQKSPGGQSEA